MIDVFVNFEGKEVELEYDAADGIEVLLAQAKCVLEIDMDIEVQLLDFAGRTVVSNSDISDVVTTQLDENGVAYLWMIQESSLDLKYHCTGTLETDVLQPASLFIDTTFRLCTSCSGRFSPDLIASHHQSLVCFKCDYSKLVDIGLAESRVDTDITHAELHNTIKLYLLRHLFDQAVSTQMQQLSASSARQSREADFKARVDSGVKTVLVYEDPMQQYSARKSIDYTAIHVFATEYLASNDGCQQDEAFLRGLLWWFKTDFFRWCNQPPCRNPLCVSGSSAMDAVGLREPNASEREFGWAGQTEVYRCGACATVTDFPRHNNPSCLLTTRSGRCGEWANAFCLVCRSLSLDARYVLDWTDHVWVEVWLPSQRRFVHLDACEQAFDTPLMYEAGWGKKLTHILSFSRYGVMDASPRYTRRFSEVVMRRAQEYALEGDVRKIVSAKDAELVSAFRVRNVAGRSNLDHAMQLSNLSIGKSFYDKLYADTGDVDISSVSERRRLCGREMQGMQFLGEGETKLEKLRGRCSGDKAWRLARGELGSRYSSIS